MQKKKKKEPGNELLKHRYMQEYNTFELLLWFVDNRL